ncbi:copper amine oxidase N-terminal domain-containing protein [Paenibacillus sp. P25]|nr:copper amine oxidase N-terminal domain-containing protein [Paenibacillus sp. P25]
MIPISDIARGLNADVAYDASTMTVTLAYGGHQASLKLNSDQAAADGTAVTLEKPTSISKTSHGYISLQAVHHLPGLSVDKTADGIPVIQTK